MANLNEIASSGASIEVIVELIAKQVEKRLSILESQRGADYESKVEQMMAEMMMKMADMQPNITVKPSSVSVPAPVINVAAPAVTVMEKSDASTIKMTFERGLNGAIESATIVKG